MQNHTLLFIPSQVNYHLDRTFQTEGHHGPNFRVLDYALITVHINLHDSPSSWRCDTSIEQSWPIINLSHLSMVRLLDHRRAGQAHSPIFSARNHNTTTRLTNSWRSRPALSFNVSQHLDQETSSWRAQLLYIWYLVQEKKQLNNSILSIPQRVITPWSPHSNTDQKAFFSLPYHTSVTGQLKRHESTSSELHQTLITEQLKSTSLLLQNCTTPWSSDSWASTHFYFFRTVTHLDHKSGGQAQISHFSVLIYTLITRQLKQQESLDPCSVSQLVQQTVESAQGSYTNVSASSHED